MVFKPYFSLSRWEGVLVCFWLLVADGVLLLWAARRPVDWIMLALLFVVAAGLPLLALLAYRTWAAFTLEYWVDRNAVTVRWANARQIIPLAEISSIVAGGLHDLTGPRWYHWPGEYLRPAQTFGLPHIAALATRPLHECLLITTAGGVFALSPADADGFVEAVQERYRLGPAAAVEMALVRTSYGARLFGNEGGGSAGLALLAAGLLGSLLITGLLMVRYPGLPDALAFHYNADGLPDVIRNKSALFILPIIGFLAWLVNGMAGLWMAVRRQPTAAYMLWGGAVVVQACSLLALISLMP